MKKYIENRLIELKKGDISEQAADAIVNAANEQLILGSGVAGAIRIKGGPGIQKECDRLSPVKTGRAVITKAGNLKAGYVIHAVGPVQGSGAEDELLRSATISALQVADGNNLKTIAFPAISTGVFGFPLESCAQIMLSAVQKYLGGDTGLEKVIFCLFDSHSFDIFEKTLIALEDNRK